VEYRNSQIISIYHSQQCFRVTGYTEEEFRADGSLWLAMIHNDDRERVRDCLNGIWGENDHAPFQHRIIHKDGSERWVINNCSTQFDREGKGLRLNGAMLDITELRNAQESNAFLAYYDPLTKLPNRSMLYNRLEKSVQLATREKKHLAILFLDLDNFKSINDTLGHDAGDKVLAEMARQLNGFVRAGDTVSRWGGDEFVIVLWDCGVDGAGFIADKFTHSEIQVEGLDLTVSMSAGISIFPDDGEDYNVLLKNADIAMYHAKNSGRKKYEFFTPAMNARVQERVLLADELRKALERNEFVLFYQPRIHIETGRISGVEALLRWRHPKKGILLPDSFLPVAEENGLIRRISEWVLLNACRQIRQLQRYVPRLPVAVNIAPAHFREKDFEDVVRTTLWETGLSPECLELEFTEDTIISEPTKMYDRLARMKALGVKLTIDDFGTGYSNLLFLQRISVDKLKIDNTFIKNLMQKADKDLVRTMINVGHSMSAVVVAEGVENAKQLAFLTKEGCDEGQGYYFCHPLPAEELTGLIAGSPNWTDKNVGFSEWARDPRQIHETYKEYSHRT
jgi:diguanylate cyclase (GGDEF)-like protein/PAS domain S-box-containing protein